MKKAGFFKVCLTTLGRHTLKGEDIACRTGRILVQIPTVARLGFIIIIITYSYSSYHCLLLLDSV